VTFGLFFEKFGNFFSNRLVTLLIIEEYFIIPAGEKPIGQRAIWKMALHSPGIEMP